LGEGKNIDKKKGRSDIKRIKVFIDADDQCPIREKKEPCPYFKSKPIRGGKATVFS